MTMMDPTLRARLAGRVLDAARAAFGGHLRAATLKGSALKGDFIPGYSDLDIHLFADPGAMRRVDVPRLEHALAFQAAFGAVEPRDYGVNSCQLFFLAWGHYPAGWVKPIPGTYELIFGELPPGFAEVDPADYLRSAHAYLPALPGWVDTLIGRAVDKPDSALAPLTRLAGTILKPTPYCAAAILSGDPFRAWRQPLDEILAAVGAEISPSGSLPDFFEGVKAWSTAEKQPAVLRRLFGLALTAMDEAAAWHARRGS